MSNKPIGHTYPTAPSQNEKKIDPMSNVRRFRDPLLEVGGHFESPRSVCINKFTQGQCRLIFFL